MDDRADTLPPFDWLTGPVRRCFLPPASRLAVTPAVAALVATAAHVLEFVSLIDSLCDTLGSRSAASLKLAWAVALSVLWSWFDPVREVSRLCCSRFTLRERFDSSPRIAELVSPRRFVGESEGERVGDSRRVALLPASSPSSSWAPPPPPLIGDRPERGNLTSDPTAS